MLVFNNLVRHNIMLFGVVIVNILRIVTTKKMAEV